MSYSKVTKADIIPGAVVYIHLASSGEYRPHTIKTLTTYVRVSDRQKGIIPSPLDNLNGIKVEDIRLDEIGGKNKEFNIIFKGEGEEPDYTHLCKLYEDGSIGIFTRSGETELYKKMGGGRRRNRKTKKARKNRRRSRRN
jgi:hypothetical protein